MKNVCALFIALLFPLFIFCQLTDEEEARIVELEEITRSKVHDSLKINALKEWEGMIYYFDYHQDSILLEEIIAISRKNLELDLGTEEKSFFAYELAQGLNYLGMSLTETGHYAESVPKYLEAITYYKACGRVDGLDGAYINMGNSYGDLGDIPSAIESYNEGIKITDKSGNTSFRANALMALGTLYNNLGDPTKALAYHQKALSFHAENENIMGQEVVYLNMGTCYSVLKNQDSALYYYQKSYEIGIQIDDFHTLGTTMHNIGETYLNMGLMDSSLIYLNKGLALRIELNQRANMIYSYGALSAWYTEKKQYSKAIEYGELAYNISLENDKEYDQIIALRPLYEAYFASGKYQKSLETYILLTNTKDSLRSVENQKALVSREVNYIYEKNKLSDSIAFENQKAINNLAHENEMRQEAQQRIGLYIGLAFALTLGVFAFIAYKRKKADNHIISEQKLQAEHQKEQIQEAHKEITDSIAYAKRIQSAILPPAKMWHKSLPDSFILYKPKDVVAGDFYWLEQKGNKTIFASADCTGHGVPGAMVSVICNGALNRSVREFNLSEPGKILDQSREIVIQEFEKSEEEVKDGMDIALCAIEGNTLQYAGAHNPLWIIRNNEIIETKANKQPIGKFDNPLPYTTHTFELQKGDCIYIFSDGYVDQFGGEKGKKLKAKAFRTLLLDIQNETMEKQKELIDETFENWKGSFEQVDDVCVIGVRV